MRTYMIYLLLTGKRLLRQLPYFLAGLAVMVLLVGMAAFSASKVLYGETSLKKIEVGVVLPEDDALSEKITKMTASLDSVESLCDFSYLEHDEAFQKMKSGELQAVFEVPSGMARGILDGTNQPATIWFPDESGLEGAVFRELAESGSSMLGTSQAAIYAADEYLNLQGVPEQISVSEQDLNRIFLKYAMNREALFRKKTVSAAGNVSTAVFYGISGIVFLMILTEIPASGRLPGIQRHTWSRRRDKKAAFPPLKAALPHFPTPEAPHRPKWMLKKQTPRSPPSAAASAPGSGPPHKALALHPRPP